jgi:X-X-X-Leu-X-X-Gly heptad repeat protein
MLGIEMGDNVEVIAKLQAAMGVVNGLQTIQTALQKQSAVMQGVQAVQAAAAAAAQTSLAGATGAATVAQKAFNLVANANPYVLLATAVAAVGTALYAFASASSKAKQEAEEMAKAEEEAAKKSEDARNAFVNASAEAMNSASRLSSLQVAYKNANSEMAKTDILKQAQQEFKKLGFECNSLNDVQTLLIKNGAKVIELIQLQGNAAAISAVRMEKFKESFKMLMENGYSAGAAATLAGYNKDVQELDGELTTMQSRIQNLKGELGVGGKGGNTKPTKTTKTAENKDVFEADSIRAYEKQIASLEDQYKRAGAALREFLLPQIEEYKKKLADLKGGGGNAQMAVGLSGFNEQTISAWTSMIKSDLAKADIGSDLYNSLTKNLRDMSFLTTTVQDAIKLGLEIPQDVVEQMYEQVFDQNNLPTDMYVGMIQKFIDDFKEKTGKDLQVGANGSLSEQKPEKQGKEEDDFKKFNDGIGKLTGGLSQVSSGLKAVGVEIPKEVDDVIGVISGVSQIISGVGSIISLFSTTAITANTAAVVANTAALGVNTATNFIPFFAGGGIVPHAANGYFVGGNKFSGDTTPIMANAGELVLNKAQQGNLAAQLEGSPVGGTDTQPYLDGEKIFLGLQAYTRRSGLGEIVTSER